MVYVNKIPSLSNDVDLHVFVEIPKGSRNKYEYDKDNISDVRRHVLKEIEHFFDVFKDLQESSVGVLGWQDVDEAQSTLKGAMHRFQQR